MGDKSNVNLNSFALYIYNFPVIKESCGWLESICLKEIDDGDRAIILAEVIDSFFQSNKKPLRKFEMMKLVAPEIKEKLEQKAINDGPRDAKMIKKFRRHPLNFR